MVKLQGTCFLVGQRKFPWWMVPSIDGPTPGHSDGPVFVALCRWPVLELSGQMGNGDWWWLVDPNWLDVRVCPKSGGFSIFQWLGKGWFPTFMALTNSNGTEIIAYVRVPADYNNSKIAARRATGGLFTSWFPQLTVWQPSIWWEQRWLPIDSP